MVGDLSSAMSSVVSLAINAGTSVEVKDATDVFIAIVTEDTPWWADWIVPIVLGEALAVAIA